MLCDIDATDIVYYHRQDISLPLSRLRVWQKCIPIFHVAVDEEAEPWRIFGRALSSKVVSTMQHAGNRLMLNDGRYADNRMASLVHAVGHTLSCSLLTFVRIQAEKDKRERENTVTDL